MYERKLNPEKKAMWSMWKQHEIMKQNCLGYIKGSENREAITWEFFMNEKLYNISIINNTIYMYIVVHL